MLLVEDNAVGNEKLIKVVLEQDITVIVSQGLSTLPKCVEEKIKLLMQFCRIEQGSLGIRSGRDWRYQYRDLKTPL
jgi:hypothetical protein